MARYGRKERLEAKASVDSMEERPKPGIRGMLLVWLIGLTLGVAAGAATAMLLMPASSAASSSQSIADRFRAN
jgi:hypothetical protein